MVNGSVENPLDGVALHDTAMTSLQLSVERLACTVEVEGSGGQLPKGERVAISCQRLHSIFTSFNFAEMLDNVWPGNVQDGRCDAAGVFRLYLTGGMVEAGATNLVLRDRGHVDDGNSGKAMSVVVSGYEALYGVDFDSGFLRRIDVSLAVGIVTVHLLMRAGDASEAVPTVLSFSGVKSCHLRLDVAAMKESVRLGNIRTVHMNVKGGIFWMYCREGFVEIVAEQVAMRK